MKFCLNKAGAVLSVTVGVLVTGCYLPGAREAIEAQRLAALDEGGSASGGAKKPGARKSSSSSSATAEAKPKARGPQADGSDDRGANLEQPKELNEAMRPPRFTTELNVLMPDNPGGSPGKTFYIAPDGKDSNPGTEAAPWATLQKAADTLEPGQTVLIKNGVYEENDLGPENWQHTDIRKSGKPGQYITYKNYPGHRPTFVVKSWNGIQINGAAYIEINGLEVRGVDDPDTIDPDAPEHFGNGISTISTDDKDKITTKAHHIRILNNYVHHVGGNGISLAGSDKVIIGGNVVYHVSHRSKAGNSGISAVSPQVAESGDTSAKYSFVIASNVSYNNVNQYPFSHVNQFTDGNGIIIDYFAEMKGFRDREQRTLIANNLCFKNGGRGIHAFKSGQVDIAYNTTFLNVRTSDLQANEGEISAVNAYDVNFVGNVAVAREKVRPAGTAASKQLSFEGNVFVARNDRTLRANKKTLHSTDQWNSNLDWLGVKHPTEDETQIDMRLEQTSPARGTVKSKITVPIDFFGKPRKSPHSAGAFAE